MTSEKCPDCGGGLGFHRTTCGYSGVVPARAPDVSVLLQEAREALIAAAHEAMAKKLEATDPRVLLTIWRMSGGVAVDSHTKDERAALRALCSLYLAITSED